MKTLERRSISQKSGSRNKKRGTRKTVQHDWDQQTKCLHETGTYQPFNSIYGTDYKQHSKNRGEMRYNVNLHPIYQVEDGQQFNRLEKPTTTAYKLPVNKRVTRQFMEGGWRTSSVCSLPRTTQLEQKLGGISKSFKNTRTSGAQTSMDIQREQPRRKRIIERINQFESERKNIHGIQKRVHKKYYKLYGRNDAYFRKLRSIILSINNQSFQEKVKHPGKQIYTYPWAGLQYKIKPGTKTRYQAEFPQKNKQPVRVIRQEFYQQNNMRKPLGYQTQYQEQFYNHEGQPADTTKMLRKRQSVEFTSNTAYSTHYPGEPFKDPLKIYHSKQPRVGTVIEGQSFQANSSYSGEFYEKTPKINKKYININFTQPTPPIKSDVPFQAITTQKRHYRPYKISTSALKKKGQGFKFIPSYNGQYLSASVRSYRPKNFGDLSHMMNRKQKSRMRDSKEFCSTKDDTLNNQRGVEIQVDQQC